MKIEGLAYCPRSTGSSGRTEQGMNSGCRKTPEPYETDHRGNLEAWKENEVRVLVKAVALGMERWAWAETGTKMVQLWGVGNERRDGPVSCQPTSMTGCMERPFTREGRGIRAGLAGR